MYRSERDYLLYLLSQQECSHAQLKQKLIQRNKISFGEIDALLQEMVDNHWQSDERYAELMIQSGLNKYHGYWRIIQKLVYEKGIERVLVEKILHQLDVDWFKQAQLCYQKKYHDQTIDCKEKQRRLQYLQRQGHSISIAREILS